MSNFLSDRFFIKAFTSGSGIFFAGVFFGYFLRRLVYSAPTSPIEQVKNEVSKQVTTVTHKSSKISSNTTGDIDLDQNLTEFKGNNGDDFKLVLLVRTDLGMTKGKIAAQCSHATLACYKALTKSKQKSALEGWEHGGQAKIAVRCNSQDELSAIFAHARKLGLCAQKIHDAGRTQVPEGSVTVCGIGPGPKALIDQVTGNLKLL